MRYHSRRLEETMRYKPYQLARCNGRIGIVAVNSRTGRLEATLYTVLEGFAGNLRAVGYALVCASRVNASLEDVNWWLHAANRALRNMP